MDLFTADLFRSFLVGFGLTAIVLALSIVPELLA